MKEKIKVTEYMLSTGGRARFRAAVVSDTHEAAPEPIVCAVRGIKPDVIILAGDIVEAKTEISAALHDGARSLVAYELICMLCRIAPVYYGLGNHEACLTERQLENIKRTDAHLLVDAYAKIKAHGQEIVIGAVSPGTPTRKTYRMLENFRRQECYRVLICHQPERYMNEFLDPRDDIAIAGHAHGGQWRFFGYGVYAPGQGLFPRYTRGFYGNLLVSAGAHNSEVIPRINDACEVLSVDFVD